MHLFISWLHKERLGGWLDCGFLSGFLPICYCQSYILYDHQFSLQVGLVIHSTCVLDLVWIFISFVLQCLCGKCAAWIRII